MKVSSVTTGSRLFSFCSAAIVVFFFFFLFPAEGAVWMSYDVTCLPEAPEICVGKTTGTTPSPASINGNITYIGGWSWRFGFVEGLENGTSYYDDQDSIENAMTGLTVLVGIDDDRTTCEIAVIGVEGGTEEESCNSCSGEGCGNDDGGSFSVRYDCTNLENGSALSLEDECVSVQRILYPFALEENNIDLQDDGNLVEEDVVETTTEEIDDTNAEETEDVVETSEETTQEEDSSSGSDVVTMEDESRTVNDASSSSSSVRRPSLMTTGSSFWGGLAVVAVVAVAALK